MFISTISWCNG